MQDLTDQLKKSGPNLWGKGNLFKSSKWGSGKIWFRVLKVYPVCFVEAGLERSKSKSSKRSGWRLEQSFKWERVELGPGLEQWRWREEDHCGIYFGSWINGIGKWTCQAEGSRKLILSQRNEKDNAGLKERNSHARRTSRSRREMVIVGPCMELSSKL